MSKTNLNKALVISIVCLTLTSFSFLGHNLGTLQNLSELDSLLKPLLDGGDKMGTSTLVEKISILKAQRSESLEAFGFGEFIGYIFSWPVANRFGRKRGILYSNSCRFIGVILHFIGLAYWTLSTSGDERAAVNSETNCRNQDSQTYQNHNQALLDNCLEIEGTLVKISSASLFADGLYSGLSTILCVLYVYEISPRSAFYTNAGSVPSIAFYFILTTIGHYILSYILPQLIYLPVNVWAWCLIGGLSLAAGLLQIFLLIKFCPESPSFLAVQSDNNADAKMALQKLRQLECVSEELEEIRKDKVVPESLKRSTFLTMLHNIYLLYYAVFLVVAGLHGFLLGISITTMVNIYFLLSSLSFVGAVFNYNQNHLPVVKLKKILFFSYVALGILFFLMFVLTISHDLKNPGTAVNAVIVLFLGCTSVMVYSSGPHVIITVLIHEYPSQANRVGNALLAQILGGLLVLLFGIFLIACAIVLSLVLPITLFHVGFGIYLWLVLGLITWFVWRREQNGDEQVGMANGSETTGYASMQEIPLGDKQQAGSEV